MKDLCHDVFGVAKEKKDPREVKTNRGISPHINCVKMMKKKLFIFCSCPSLKDLKNCNVCSDLLDALPEKRSNEEGGYSSDEGPNVLNHNHLYIIYHDTIIELFYL